MIAVMRTSFGELVRAGRERNKWLGRELASKLEIDAATLSRIEKGNYKDTPPPHLIDRISEVLEIPQTTLLESLGYRISGEDAPVYDELSASISRAVADWTPEQKKLLWNLVQTVGAIMDANDPEQEEDDGVSATGD